MAEKKERRAGEHVEGEPKSDFTLLKDDFVAGVGEAEIDHPPTPSLPRKGAQSDDLTPNLSLERRGSQTDVSAASSSERSLFEEVEPEPVEVSANRLGWATRRDFLLYGASVAAVAGGVWWLLPQDASDPNNAQMIKNRIVTPSMRKEIDSLTARAGLTTGRQDRFLKRVLTFDDDVAEALYSPTRSVPTYDKSAITPHLRNNYDGQTPDPGYIDGWTLTLSGLASGKTVQLTAAELLSRFTRHEQITRLCCVEGWSAIAWWGGLRFADLLAAYPPAPGMRWAAMRSEVNLDSDGNSDPYYVSIDIPTAMHPQTLLAMHLDGKPLDVGHGAPLRLLVPMKLGLKNIKAITSIEYVVKEPADYWNERGYSKYDGL